MRPKERETNPIRNKDKKGKEKGKYFASIDWPRKVNKQKKNKKETKSPNWQWPQKNFARNFDEAAKRGISKWQNKDDRKPPCKMTENGRGL